MANLNRGRLDVGTRVRAFARPSSAINRAGRSLATRSVVHWRREGFRFLDARIYQLADPDMAVAEVRAEGIVKATGRKYQQEYVVFLWASDGKIARLREYFDPVRAASAFGAQVQYSAT